MSNQVATEKTARPARRERIRIRVESLRRAPKLGILGLSEMIALGVSLLLLAVVLFTYFYLFIPARNRQTHAMEQRELLQKRLREAQVGFNANASTAATVGQIDKSLQDFEETRLSPGDEGKMSIYQELNELIRRNALRATGGIKYIPLDALGAQTGTNTPATRGGNAKWQSVYPGLGVSLTVEGPYANVRRFVRDIEASRQFVIINAVELEGANNTAAPPVVQPLPGAAPGTATPPSSIVSLRLDMAAYFRRNASNTGTEQQQQQPQPSGTPRG
jgi:Tfp pilus assembly protein PilO